MDPQAVLYHRPQPEMNALNTLHSNHLVPGPKQTARVSRVQVKNDAGKFKVRDLAATRVS